MQPDQPARGPCASFFTAVYRFFGCFMLQLTPRAYILSFALLILGHHLPLWVIWSRLDVDPSSVCYRDFHRWTSQTLVLHILIPSICVISILISLFSTVYRSKIAPWTLHETPLIVLVFLLYIVLALWDIIGFRKSLVDECLHDINQTSVIVFDLAACCFVIVLWLFTSCTWRQRTQDDTRDSCAKLMRCLTTVFLCKRHDSGDEDADGDMFSLLAEAMSQFLYVRRRDYENVLPIADVIFALHLLAKAPPSPRTQGLVAAIPDRVSMLDDGTRYGKLAGGIYGWRLFLYYHPCACHKVLPCCQSRAMRRHMNEVHESTSHWFHAGPRDDVSFVHYTGLDHTSVQYMTTANSLCQVPFSVCRDDDRKELVVIIRGSISWNDVLTDILARNVPMADDEAAAPPHGGPVYTHEGALRTARHLLHELQSGKLKQSFWDFAMTHCRHDDPSANWRIVATGHSLGGAIATILVLMLRKHFHAVGQLYAPMPCLDEATAEWSTSFLTSFIYGDDWVPRFTLSNMVRLMFGLDDIRLRNELMQEYQRVSNVRLIHVWLARFDPTRIEPQVHPEWADLELLPNDYPNTLTIPGTIYQIEPVDEARMCTCEWLRGPQPLQCVRRHRSEFDRIWINYRAPIDHLPHHYDHSINQVKEALRDQRVQDVL
ncbi:Aste57867_22329 [Aphanomyces stellatus]|uniref:sn-1-specific diacylglycerol lipase n=1 Tax=Aphanomyces stellatus TaxID=120398 RepID=A0A485LL99_9STRA|nr:hypothetical protein As57867_022259 [Aphanomyces stellatus]VFT98992.1 Aste57867_22329 [Aphanomyces stellatus]